MTTTQLDGRGVIEPCPNCGQKNRVLYSALGQAARCGRCHTELATLQHPLEIDEDSAFQCLTHETSLPVLVDFWADWCGPCKMMAPEVTRVAASNSGKLVVAKVNTEGLPVLAQRFQISALPTLVLFLSGRELARAEGARPAVQIQRFVDQTLRAGPV